MSKTCKRCGQPVDNERFVYCPECRQKNHKAPHEYYMRRVNQRQCPDCGAQATPGSIYCKACFDYHTKRRNMLRADRKAHGLCVRCGKAKEDNGRLQCNACRENDRIRAEKYRPQRLKVREVVNANRAGIRRQWAGAGLCTRCGGPNEDRQWKSCRKCREMCANYRARERVAKFPTVGNLNNEEE